MVNEKKVSMNPTANNQLANLMASVTTTAPKGAEIFNTDIGTGGCFIKNVGKTFEQIDNQFYEESTDKIQIKGADVLPLLKLLWSNVKTSLEDCKGKTIEITNIELGDSQVANLTEAVLQILLVQFLNENND